MLSGSLEENVLTLLVWSEEHAADIAVQLDADIFSSKTYQRIAEASINYIETYGRPPCAHMSDILERELDKPRDGELLAQTLQAMQRLAPELQPQYVLQKLGEFIDARNLTKAIDEASDALYGGDIRKAREILLRDAGELEDDGHNEILLNDPDQALSFLIEREEDYFSSGIEILDRMRIRPRRGELFVLIAPAKRGKSWFLVNVGKHSLLTRKRVLHITLEMPAEQVAKRYVQCLLSLTASESESIVNYPVFVRDGKGSVESIQFKTKNALFITKEQRPAMYRRLAPFKNRSPLIIKSFPTSTLTLGMLKAYLESLARRKNFIPDIVLLDYPDLMSLDESRLRIALSQLYKELRGLAVARNFALVAVSQGNRMSESAKLVGVGHVAEDFSKIGTADTILTYNRTKMEKALGLARISVPAARDAPDGFIALITQAYSLGQFCLDSTYMDTRLVEELKSLTNESTEGDDDSAGESN